LPFLDFIQFSLGWPVWLAAAGVLAILSLLVAIPLTRRPQAKGLLARTLMSGATLRDRLLVGFRLIAVVPVLTLLPLLAVISTMTVRDAQLPQIERLAASIATSVPQLVQSQVTGIESLAGHITAAGHADELALREALLRHHLSSQGFASLWVAQRNGDVVAATAVKGGRVEPWAGPVSGVAMMDSFKRAVIAGVLYVSPVKKGAASDEAPMMFVSAPISLNGNPNWGFVQGLLNLRIVVGGMVSQGTIDSVSTVITDQRNRVILASPGLALPSFSDLSGHPLMTAAATEGLGKVYSFSGVVNNDGGTARYVAVSKPLDNGWQVFAAATQAKADLTVLIYMALGLIWALFALILARGIAPLYGEVVAQPLQKLEESLEVFDAARTITIIPPAPSDAPQEIRQTYARVRESMQNSRDAYRNMLKVVNEGNELRQKLRTAGASVSQKLRTVSGKSGNRGDELGANDQTIVAERSSGTLDPALSQEAQSSGKALNGQLDPVTELAGRDVFEGFFGEAWMLGAADSRPISVINLRIGTTDDQTLKLIAQKLKAMVGRTLDFIGYIAEWNFSIILPDTDLQGALAVADRIREMLQEHKIKNSFGVATIVPNINGNAKSFLDITQRALEAAHQKGDGQIVFVSDRGKLTLHTSTEPASTDMIDWDMSEEASA